MREAERRTLTAIQKRLEESLQENDTDAALEAAGWLEELGAHPPKAPEDAPPAFKPPRPPPSLRSHLRALRRIQRAAPTAALADHIRELEKRIAPKLPSALPQLVFPVVSVWCPRQEGRISLAECAKQRTATEPSGAGKGHMCREQCKACPLAEVHRDMTPGYVAPKFRRFNVNREAKQRQARQKLWKVGALDEIRTIDNPVGEE
jgi:hypothetical protein